MPQQIKRLARIVAASWAAYLIYSLGSHDGYEHGRAEAIETAGEMLADAEFEHRASQAALRAEFGKTAAGKA